VPACALAGVGVVRRPVPSSRSLRRLGGLNLPPLRGREALLECAPPETPRKGECEKTRTTLGNGYLGSCNDEERSEMRYVV